ncbi:MAG: methylase involved in ubiquinone/menaquinone biosynthesis [Marmoricola sp.]|nr:methylase involved in ubiquinone/menaquinone biosynthesis [Marmoricola sp.]
MSVSGRVFARLYDRLMAGAEAAGLQERRQKLLAGATGDVLEIGAGTGANLVFYPDSISTLTMTEPESPMVRLLERHLGERRSNTKLLRAPAEDLPFPDNTFDTVVSTLTLCTVDDQPRALRELARVLRPGGQLLFIEHVRADDERLARWQDRLNGLNRVIAHGCNCNRATLAGLQQFGFTIRQVEHGDLEKAPPFVRPLVVGIADAA